MPESRYGIDFNEAPWMKFAEEEIGVHEYEGDPDNPKIIEYHSTTTYGAKDDEVAWCSAFVNWCMKKAGIRRTGSASARSWLNWGEMLSEPRKGCVVVLWRNNPDSWQGHVGFYVGESANSSDIDVLGGNQNDSVNVSAYPKTRVLGYRWNT